MTIFGRICHVPRFANAHLCHRGLLGITGGDGAVFYTLVPKIGGRGLAVNRQTCWTLIVPLIETPGLAVI